MSEKKYNTHQTFLDRIKISESGCWEWHGSRDQRGYGKFTIGGVYWRAHRYSYQYHKGEIGNLSVLHKCDNPPCCNPDHLFLGNAYENAIDMLQKKRGNKAKLSIEEVLDIKALSADLIPPKVISEYLEIKIRNVYNVVYGKRWIHLTNENKNTYKI